MKPLDKAYGDIPACFHTRVTGALQALEEEKPMKKTTWRTALITALLITLVGGIAYAAIVQGQEWYYNNRFTAYREHEPAKYDAILAHLTADVTQSTQGSALIDILVQDAAYVPETRLLTLSLRAVPRDAAQYELHPLWNLDADGAYMGAGYPANPGADGEDRGAHWLWTVKGFGPVAQMMNDPGKTLLLVNTDGVYGAGDGTSMDAFVGEDGAVITVLETCLSAEAVARGEDGTLTLALPFTVSVYREGDDSTLYTGDEKGEITFTLSLD